MKSTLNSLLSLSFSLLLASACAPQAPQGETTGGDLSLLSNGPNLPEECNTCWDDFQTCFADGNDMEECAQQIVDCVDTCQAPPPPPECLHCAAGFEACATTAQDNGTGAEDCAVGFEGCLSACESESFCEQSPELCDPDVPPTDLCGGCDLHFDECINDQWGDNGNDPSGETQQCEDLWQDCWQSCDDQGDDPSDPNDPGDEGLCEELLDQCQNSADGNCTTPDGQEVSCQDVVDACLGQGDPGGNDECNFCHEVLDQCADGNGGEDCADLQDHCAQVCQ